MIPGPHDENSRARVLRVRKRSPEKRGLCFLQLPKSADKSATLSQREEHRKRNVRVGQDLTRQQLDLIAQARSRRKTSILRDRQFHTKLLQHMVTSKRNQNSINSTDNYGYSNGFRRSSQQWSEQIGKEPRPTGYHSIDHRTKISCCKKYDKSLTLDVDDSLSKLCDSEFISFLSSFSTVLPD